MEIISHAYKLLTYPLYVSIISLLSIVIMFNVKKQTVNFSYYFRILISVMIYYVYYLINLLGINGKIPMNISAILPLIILSLLISVGLVRINEK